MTVKAEPAAPPEADLAMRPTAPHDGPALVKFARMVFGVAWTEAFVRWKYFENPAGPIFGQCAEVDGQPAAYYGNIPVRLKVGEQIVMAAQAVDAMVAPEARRRRVFVRLAQETYRRMDEAGVALAWVFPSAVARVAFVERLGWTPVGQAPRYVCVLDPEAAARAGGRAGLAARLYALWLRVAAPANRQSAPAGAEVTVKLVTGFEARFDELWQAIAPQFGIAAVRDAAYLNWRYAKHPASPYTILTAERGPRLAGYAVLSRRDAANGVAALVEFLTLPGDEAAGGALLAAALRLAREWRCAEVQSWLLPHHHYYRRLLEQFGFAHRPGRFAPGMLHYTTPFIIRQNPALQSSIDPAVIDHWYLSAGDYDYF